MQHGQSAVLHPNTMTEFLKENRAQECARRCLEHIKGLMHSRWGAVEKEDDGAMGEAITAIQESAYGVSVRSDWLPVGKELEPGEYLITLAGGGPAARLRGLLNDLVQPYTARLEYQDWFEPWTEYLGITEEENEILLGYAGEMFPW